LEKVRDIVNNAFANLFPVDDLDIHLTEDTLTNDQNGEAMQIDSVEKEDRLMCEIVDEIPF
jgi:hypothetical protein